MAKQKTFTLEEAQTLVPVLRSLIKRAMDDKGVIEAVEKELLDLKHRILLSGGLFVDVPVVARRRAERRQSLSGHQRHAGGNRLHWRAGKRPRHRPARFSLRRGR